LLIWAGLIFLFFSKSNSKLIPYILPTFPPLAILIAHHLEALLESRGRELKLAPMLLGVILTILGIASLAYHHLPTAAAIVADVMPQLSEQLRRFTTNAPLISFKAGIIVGILFLIQGLSCLVSGGRYLKLLLCILCTCSFLLEILLPKLIMAPIAQMESPQALAIKALSLAAPDTKIVTFGPMQAVSWYTGRRVLVAGKLDELAFGSKQGDQTSWFPDPQTLLKLWNSNDHLLMILKKRELQNLLPQLTPAPNILGESGKLVLIGNR